ncbi:MAG: succinylglutamate desuccinylase/aspartoacylase family protein [Nanoarchaeota archaeon]
MKVYEFSNGKGPKVAIVACLHGDEIIGKLIIDKLIENIKNGKFKFKGTLKLIVANEEAMKARERFIDSDLNRVFPGNPNGNHEEKLAYKLLKELKDFDYVVDIYSTITETPSFVILTKEEMLDLAKKVPLKRILVMSPKLVKEKALIGHVKGISIEFNHKINPSIAYKIVKETLENIYNNKDTQIKQGIYYVKGILRKEKVGKLLINPKNFKRIKKGTIIEKKVMKKFISILIFIQSFIEETKKPKAMKEYYFYMLLRRKIKK